VSSRTFLLTVLIFAIVLDKTIEQNLRIKVFVKLKETAIETSNLLGDVYGERGSYLKNSHKLLQEMLRGLKARLKQDLPSKGHFCY
jgi:hypothetical protein